MVYLNAATELEAKKHPDKEIIPAGILYYQIQDPVLDLEPEEEPEEGQEREPEEGQEREPEEGQERDPEAAAEAALKEAEAREAEISRRILEKLKPGGLLNSAPDVLKLLDQEGCLKASRSGAARQIVGASSGLQQGRLAPGRFACGHRRAVCPAVFLCKSENPADRFGDAGRAHGRGPL